MPRSYWHIVLAVVGWVALSGANYSPLPKQSSAQNDAQTEKQIERSAGEIAAAIDRSSDSGNYQEPCGKGQYNRESDLCAQWSAADEARRAADYTEWAFFAAIFGSVLAFCALIYTAKGTRAAIEAVEAQIIADRPIVTLSHVSINADNIDDPETSRKLNVRWTLSNTGATGCWTEHVLIDVSGIVPSDNPPENETLFSVVSHLPPGRGLSNSQDSGAVYELTPEEFAPIIRDRRVYVVGWSIYHDAGGRRWKTGFAGWTAIDLDYAGNGFAFYPSRDLWFDERLPKDDGKKWKKALTRKK